MITTYPDSGRFLRRAEVVLFIPILLLPSIYFGLAVALMNTWGVSLLCSPTLLIMCGIASVVFCSRMILQTTMQPAFKLLGFFAVMILVYLQIYFSGLI
ncbi:hypothetical protein [Rubellicoccus peritrichatus]|uniref:Uncharacterized protein n=1 Tax=Rubellicoccus peritrichatus TaxID=3080537 RepID=A0AAQ3LEQ4_9BACT|nr:hypothetical protein [Puniceicoccus sp. CR14]WOO42268.1 hypothetical protein RZN69_04145 [Puniceicoccus sp. CR14]